MPSYTDASLVKKKVPFAHTYSIVARDPITGDMGVAVQSHWFSVGSVVTWGEAGIGTIATQAFANISFGPRGLELLRKGMDAKSAIDALIASDEAREMRQLAILDAKGGRGGPHWQEVHPLCWPRHRR